MALSRKFLAAMDIPSEKIEEIINAHTETVEALKEDRDKYKADADKLQATEKELAKANDELEKFKSGDWENKYNTIKGEYDTFKKDTESKAAKSAKENAYKQLLIDAGISDKRISTILKVSDLESIKLDKDGKIEDAEKLTESVKTEWADFIQTKHEEGAGTATPPGNDGKGGEQPSRAAQLAAQYQKEHYGSKEE